MTKKIFDIIPPEKIEEDSREVLPSNPEKIKKSFLKWPIFLFGFLFIITVVGSFLFPKATLSLKPETSRIELEETITMDLGAQIADFNSKTIPAKLFEDERSLKKEFSSTGRAATEKKATGTIVVYNEYSSSTRTLIPSRFVSPDGKLFWSTKKITIPGYKKEGGRIIPGQAEVTVEASEAGEEYNIGATTFALPALAGSPLYTTIYAKSFSSMTGGAIGEVSQVSREDLRMAEQSLAQEIKNQSLDYLKQSLPEGYVLLEETISQEIMETSNLAEIGEFTDSFEFEAKIKSNGFAFKKDDLDRFVREFINLNMEDGKSVLENSLSLEYELRSTNLNSGQLVLGISIKTEVYKDIDELELKKALLGKQLAKAEMFLGSLEGISAFEIRNRPFFKRKLPEDIDKLEVILVLD